MYQYCTHIATSKKSTSSIHHSSLPLIPRARNTGKQLNTCNNFLNRLPSSQPHPPSLPLLPAQRLPMKEGEKIAREDRVYLSTIRRKEKLSTRRYSSNYTLFFLFFFSSSSFPFFSNQAVIEKRSVVSVWEIFRYPYRWWGWLPKTNVGGLETHHPHYR